MDYQYNDYELIYMIKESSEEALKIIIDKYDPIIKSMAFSYVKKYSIFNFDEEDLIQEGRIALCNAINKYDENKNVLFYSFLLLCVKGAMNNIVRKAFRKQDLLIEDYIECENYDMNIADKDCYNPLNICEDFEMEKYIINFKNTLNDLESAIFELRLNNFKYSEIASLLDIKLKKVDNEMLKIKMKLKKYLLNL